MKEAKMTLTVVFATMQKLYDIVQEERMAAQMKAEPEDTTQTVQTTKNTIRNHKKYFDISCEMRKNFSAMYKNNNKHNIIQVDQLFNVYF